MPIYIKHIEWGVNTRLFEPAYFLSLFCIFFTQKLPATGTESVPSMRVCPSLNRREVAAPQRPLLQMKTTYAVLLLKQLLGPLLQGKGPKCCTLLSGYSRLLQRYRVSLIAGGGQIPRPAVQAAAGRFCAEDLPHAARQREEGDHSPAGGLHPRPADCHHTQPADHEPRATVGLPRHAGWCRRAAAACLPAPATGNDLPAVDHCRWHCCQRTPC